jgi:hypothetical protein
VQVILYLVSIVRGDILAKKGSKKPKKNSIPNEENIVVQDIEEPKDISNDANEKIDTTDTQLENSVSQDIVAEAPSTEEVIEVHDETTTEEVIEAIEETVIEENSSTEEIAETTEVVEQNSSLVNETETTIPQDDNIIDVETAETVLEEPKQVSKTWQKAVWMQVLFSAKLTTAFVKITRQECL